ncbi:flavodoxin family protein [Methanobrevibacter sp. UBA337]|jgi:multimeric flavodoxin WrbA|uniref:flavodoxin family protein n=1 Tax=Methanobrevibacter sp. UBA337 TaxID=1915480 RepID=UPI0039B8E7C2
MKVTAIIASPRKGGNGDVLVDEIIKGTEENGAEVTKYYIDELDVEPCHACGHCGDGIDCKVEDDGAKIIDDLLDTDVLIFTTPIYYGQMSAQGKLITDRFYSVSRNPQKEFNGKAVLVFTHGAPSGIYDAYIEATKASPFGHTGWDVVNTLDAGGIQEPGPIKESEDKMKEAFEIGKAL